MIHPIFKQDYTTVVFSCDANYVPYLAVAVSSLVANSKSENRYDVVILHGGIADYLQKKILADNNEYQHVSIRFFDVSDTISQYKYSFFSVTRYITLAAYYRLFIPVIFEEYEKVIYLDCDLIVNSDIAELAKIDIGDNLIAAVRESIIEIQYKHRLSTKLFIDKVLRLPCGGEDYFNSGVMVCNVAEMRRFDLTSKSINSKFKGTFYHDQDILNIICRERVFFLDYRWNYQWYIYVEFWTFVKKYFPPRQLQEYVDAGSAPRIMHYSSAIKPWNRPQPEFASMWWYHARRTSFYEEIIYKNAVTSKSLKRKKIGYYLSAGFNLIFLLVRAEAWNFIERIKSNNK